MPFSKTTITHALRWFNALPLNSRVDLALQKYCKPYHLLTQEEITRLWKLLLAGELTPKCNENEDFDFKKKNNPKMEIKDKARIDALKWFKAKDITERLILAIRHYNKSDTNLSVDEVVFVWRRETFGELAPEIAKRKTEAEDKSI